VDRLAQEKATLRARMRAVRDAIPPAERAHLADRIDARLRDLPEVRRARTVLLFYSFGSEVPTSGIARRLLGGGRRVLLPYLEASTMEAAELRAERPPVTSTYGPKEPPERVPVDPSEVDVVLTPGLGFDRDGYRIGYGGGYYDRYLSRLGPHATRIGVGFDVQVVEAVPHGELDQRLDFVVTDRETIDCRPPGRVPGSGVTQ
jgi:5-formyltetrahydrofolate cyclo-ligase